ncbi:hypothetical protein [Treponema sp.]|uniref:hypothetical protein n=1 Tax=Treponema sp. TaxID=166 RepID=UPI003F0282C1
MKKFYVKWGFTDDYGRAYEKHARYDWFETQDQAEEFITQKRKGNGGYFKLWKTAEGDYTKFLRIIELEKELAELKKIF